MLGFDALGSIPLAGDELKPIAATLSATQESQTLSALSSSGAVATLTATQDSNTISADAAVALVANGSFTQAANTISADAAVAVAANSSLNQDANTISAEADAIIFANASLTQAANSISASGIVFDTTVNLNGDITQADNTLSSLVAVDVTADLDITQSDQISVTPVYVVAPGYSHWKKTQDKKKPQAPKLPEPAQRGELVVDEEVLRQAEIDRIAAEVLQKKQDALVKVEENREQAWAKGVTSIDGSVSYSGDKRAARRLGERISEAPANESDRHRVVRLLGERPPPPAVEPVALPRVTRALGARNLPAPEMRLTKSITLRRDGAVRYNQYGT